MKSRSRPRPLAERLVELESSVSAAGRARIISALARSKSHVLCIHVLSAHVLCAAAQRLCVSAVSMKFAAVYPGAWRARERRVSQGPGTGFGGSMSAADGVRSSPAIIILARLPHRVQLVPCLLSLCRLQTEASDLQLVLRQGVSEIQPGPGIELPCLEKFVRPLPPICLQDEFEEVVLPLLHQALDYAGRGGTKHRSLQARRGGAGRNSAAAAVLAWGLFLQSWAGRFASRAAPLRSAAAALHSHAFLGRARTSALRVLTPCLPPCLPPPEHTAVVLPPVLLSGLPAHLGAAGARQPGADPAAGGGWEAPGGGCWVLRDLWPGRRAAGLQFGHV